MTTGHGLMLPDIIVPPATLNGTQIYEPRPEKDHGPQRIGTIADEADIYGPRNGRADLDLRSAGTDVNDDTPVVP